MGTHPTRLDRVLAAESQSNIEGLRTADVRDQRAEASRVETDLSYLRRLLHGRIDIIDAEIRRRASGDAAAGGSIVDQLPSILADAPSRAPRSVRHIGVQPGPDPGEYRLRKEAELEALELSDVLDRPDAELAAARIALAAMEAEVSGHRVRVQAVVDRFAGELMRRYREGEATVDDLLDAAAAADPAVGIEHRME
jgi:hypothetical protein